MSQSRIWAIVIVALLHALLGYAFVTGLAYKVAKQIQEDLKTFDVAEEQPPPEEEPPPPEPVPETQPPPVVAPPPIVRTNTPPPPVTTVRTAPPAPITFTAPPAPPAPPPPPPPPPPPKQQAQPARHRSGSISDDDYPASAIRAEAEGTTTVRLTIGTNGRVSNCTVTGSSGNSALDSTTCSLIQRRFRYRPAEDNQGNAVTDTITQRVQWRLPN